MAQRATGGTGQMSKSKREPGVTSARLASAPKRSSDASAKNTARKRG